MRQDSLGQIRNLRQFAEFGVMGTFLLLVINFQALLVSLTGVRGQCSCNPFSFSTLFPCSIQALQIGYWCRDTLLETTMSHLLQYKLQVLTKDDTASLTGNSRIMPSIVKEVLLPILVQITTGSCFHIAGSLQLDN